ncbi:CRISPR-associated protein Cas1, partial [mine drainage metagenome]
MQSQDCPRWRVATHQLVSGLLSIRGGSTRNPHPYANASRAGQNGLKKCESRLWPEARFVTRKGKGKSWAQSATDPVNALLNFGYSLLEGRVRHAVNSVGLMPEIGFLHETAASKLPLVYDLQEGFRWLVDLSVVETVSGRQLDRKADFLMTENFHVRLRPRAIGLFSQRLSENFNRAVPF